MPPKTKSRRKRLNMRGGIKTAIQNSAGLAGRGLFLKVYTNAAQTERDEAAYLEIEGYADLNEHADYFEITVSLNAIDDAYLFDSDEANMPINDNNPMYVKLSAEPHADQYVYVNQLGGGRRHDTIELKIKKVGGHECEHPLYREMVGGFLKKKKKKRTRKL
jgi:hypothetical protein